MRVFQAHRLLSSALSIARNSELTIADPNLNVVTDFHFFLDNHKPIVAKLGPRAIPPSSRREH
jgi:hypothetical protein